MGPSQNSCLFSGLSLGCAFKKTGYYHFFNEKNWVAALKIHHKDTFLPVRLLHVANFFFRPLMPLLRSKVSMYIFGFLLTHSFSLCFSGRASLHCYGRAQYYRSQGLCGRVLSSPMIGELVSEVVLTLLVFVFVFSPSTGICEGTEKVPQCECVHDIRLS